MGKTNDAHSACGTPLLRLQAPNARFTLCGACKKAGYRHIVLANIQPGNYQKLWPRLEKEMFLTKPDGSSHSPLFESLIPHKIKGWITRQVTSLIINGTATHTYDAAKGYRLVYADWTKAWLLPEWEGEDLTEAGARKLLAQYGDPIVTPLQTQNSIVDPIQHRVGFADPFEMAPAIHALPTILQTSEDDIYPDDSCSTVGKLKIGLESCAADYSVVELEEILRQGAIDLWWFSSSILLLKSRLLCRRMTIADGISIEKDINHLFAKRLELLGELIHVEFVMDEIAGEGLESPRYPFKGRLWAFWLTDVTGFMAN